MRPYTGFDGYQPQATPGLEFLRDIILYLNAGKVTHLGSHQKRDIKGKPGLPSVHATGRAVDIGYNNRTDIEPILKWLTAEADTLGIELIVDYWIKPWGRAWRCDRNRWKVYDKRTVAGAPGGRWIHLEIAPTHTQPGTMEAAVKKALEP